MGRSRFPGKPLKFQNRKRVSVLSGVVYNDAAPESQPPNEGAPANVFSEEKEEEEKEKKSVQLTPESVAVEPLVEKQEPDSLGTNNKTKSPVRTRSHNKMETKTEKPKVKKSVSFGTVESCEDTFLPLKKLPSRHQLPLASIIKKKSALKHTEYSTFSSILKPAILTGLSSKLSLDQDAFSRKLLNPLTKSVSKFSQLSEGRCISPPPRNSSPADKESSSKFVLPLRSSHSSRVIKPNKKFFDGEDTANTGSSLSAGKLLKKPKLKRIVFNNVPQDEESGDGDSDKEKDIKDKSSLPSSSLFKDKTTSFSSINTGVRKPRDLFTPYEKEYSQDENSNVERLENKESHKEDRSGHALRKLVDISDASSTSGSSTGTESEESWDSDENENIEEEEEEPPPSPEKEKAPASQLLSGKVIIREARLQLTPPVVATPGQDGPFSTPHSAGSGPSPNQATTVTCGVCGAVRFYKFVKQARKFGIYSCESCRKFISKMLKKEKASHITGTGPIVMHCIRREGNCHVPPIVRSQQWKFKRCANKARCPACWLKLCLKAFQVPPSIRAALTSMLPKYMGVSTKQPNVLTPANPLRISTTNTLAGQPTFGALSSSNDTETKSFNNLQKTKKPTEETVSEKPDEKPCKMEKLEKQMEEDELLDESDANRKRRLTRVKVKIKDKPDVTEDTKRQKVELKGPRVKHVCRSASIVLGQPIATFPTQEEKDRDKSLEDLHETKDIEPVYLPICDNDSENKSPDIDKDDVVAIVKDETESIEAKKRKVEPSVSNKVIVKGELSEDDTMMELVPRKAAFKPLTNISNTRGRPQKCGQNRPELICVDFWESYDPDEVCSTGFGVIGTAPFTVAKLCFLCGSAGMEKMLICTSCCEWTHTWCADDGVASSTPNSSSSTWVCPRCRECAACGGLGGSTRCRTCTKHYHDKCLQPPPTDRRTDWPQICSSCLKCKSCDSEKVSKFVGSLPFCGSCFRLRRKGNYCPLCQACYRDNDFDSKMMECGWCSRWVHASCEGLTGEGYQLLSALPPSIEYICRQCMPHDPPWRKMLTEHLKGRLLHLLKLLAKNRNACALLKLTPHKNTPVPNKSYRFMSPQAIRRLHFDDSDTMKNTTETKVYRNTSRTRRNIIKPDDANVSKLWELPESSRDDLPHTSHKVVNLQEPLMQNKEICFSTASADKSEIESHCVEVHENEHPKDENNEAKVLPLSVDKFEPISDEDEPMNDVSLVRSEQDQSPVILRRPDTPKLENIEEQNRLNSPSLLDIKKRVNNDEYVSLKDFNREMKEVIERTASMDLITIYKVLFSETFPWFDCENNCIQPTLEVEGENNETESVKDQEMPEDTTVAIKQDYNKLFDQIVPKFESESLKSDKELLEFYPVTDTRSCILCKVVGDGVPEMEGRLLYCGQNDWIHANCALWSAEVFEEIDGSLQNVHSAISRGKMIKCPTCDVKGASVGCCAKNCGETYHYACARKSGCAFLDDKRVFCPPHGKDVPKKSLQKNADFELTRPVYVELDKKKKRYSEISKVQFLLGSLTVQNLGKIVPSVSDFEEFLMPVDFQCTRLFWSCKKPLKIVRYTIKTKLILAEPLPGFDYGVNITVDHSKGAQVVDRVMAEIGAWHKSVESGAKPTRLLKHDKSPIKLGSKVTLEDIAVKQVVEYLLDNVCRQEQQDEDEPQNTADLLPPELKDAIFEDLNHDLLDGISMQDIFPKLMSYEDLVAMDLKGEFYGAISQADDKTNTEPKSTTDFIDELLSSGGKELKRSKSEMLLQNHGLKSLTTGRGQPRSSSLTWSNKIDSNLLSSTMKRVKMGRSSTVTGKQSPIPKALLENTLDPIKETDTEKNIKEESQSSICSEAAHGSGLNYRTTSPKEEKDTESSEEKSDKSEGYFADVIDFYTKIQCSPIAQLDGTADWSSSESTCSSRPGSPEDFTPIRQLDGADDNRPNEVIARSQTNQFLYRASGSESTYTVTIAGNSINGQPELVMRPLDDGTMSNQMEQPVRCDRCQCTYRNKESYDRHVPTCDMMSTSESESENPKSPENRTLTTLQNAFGGAFAQPMIIHAVSGTESTHKADGIASRRTSINTRQITINGTIVETPSSGQSNEMTMTITEQMKSGALVIDQSKTTNVQVSANQQIMSSPQLVVTPQMLMPPKSTAGTGQKIMTQHMITPQGMMPYNICVKPGNGNVQQIQSGSDMAHLLSGAGGIQVLSSNSNQVLTIPNNQHGNLTPIIQGKAQVTNFPNMASASSITLPVNSIHGMSNSQIIQNIQPMIRPNLQGNHTIMVPTMTPQRMNAPNNHNKQQILISTTHQKSPKKHPTPVQPKPIFQAANKPRGRPMPKPTTIKRQTKVEKTFTTINQPLGGNTVIQLQTNNQGGQPSIMIQPVGNQNLMSAYVEALSQQQNQNMQYIATIAPQNDFKPAQPTQFISQGGMMPQTFQIQQTENGGLIAVPSGGIPVLFPSQGNVGLLPQTLQQGATILPQGLQQGIISQGPNGPTIIPQTIQNGTIIPQGTLQGLTQGNLTSQATLLPTNSLHTSGTQGTILPQFCNDQNIILGSAPTLEMVTDPSGCMYLTATQPVYYGLETIVQNTVMSSQQFVSTAMQGVLAQNSSFSATTTQVFQASKIEPIVEVPTGYVVVNNAGDVVNQVTSSANVVQQNIQTSPQNIKSKTPIPNLTLQPLPDKSNNNRQAPKVIQMSAAPVIISSGTIFTGRQSVNPITSQIHCLSLANSSQNVSRASGHKTIATISVPNVTLVSSTGQPLMAISQSIPNSTPSFSLQSIPLSQPIVSSSIAPSAKNMHPPKSDSSHMIEVGGNLQDSSNSNNLNTISVPQNLKSPTPWRQVSQIPLVCSNANHTTSNESNKSTEQQNQTVKVLSCTTINTQNHMPNRNLNQQNDPALMNSSHIGNSAQVHQFDSNVNVSHHSTSHNHSNVIQISSGSIYPPPPSMTTSFDAETAIKLNKINALTKTEGGHMNFSQEIMASHSQQHAQNEKTFQNIGNNDKHNVDNMHNQVNMPKLSSCQLSGGNNLNLVRQQSQNTSTVQNNQMCSMTSTNNSSVMQIANPESNIGMACQETSNNRSNSMTNENILQPNCGSQQQSTHPSPIQHGNMSMLSHDTNHHPTNQIHIMNGQIQHNNGSQMQQNNNMMNMGSGRSFHDNLNQSVPNRATPDNLMNQNMNMHNVGNNHSLNRSPNDMSHMHMQQSLPNMNSNMQNRLPLDNMACHDMNNMGLPMHSNRSIDNMHNQMVNHNMSQMNHHMNTSNRQLDPNLHQQMPMPQSRQIESTSHHHQHQMPNVMQLHNNRPHVDNSMMGLHHIMPNQMHNRQMDNSMHLHHNMSNSGSMTPIPPLHNRHDNNSMNMQNLNSINQMQNNRGGIEHPTHLHQMNNMNAMNNMAMHNNMSNSMQMGNNHQPMMQVQSIANNIPDIKNDLQNSCGGSCSNNSLQFGNQSQFDMCAGNPNMNMPSSNMMHGMNMNNANMMMNNNYNQAVSHDMLMSCNNPSDIMSGNANHMMMNSSQNHSNTQININSCMNSNNAAQNQMPNVDPQMNRPNITINEQPKFVPEPCRGKNMTPMQPVPNNDCAKVNLVNNEKQNHTISVNNQMNFMSINPQNNRVINLPGNRLNNNSNLENNQHMPQQHNIRVVTNNNNNGAIASDTLAFQQKNENSTMINVPFQAIPNSVPMNINVNSSNNTVNITVQNNLVDPKIASKGATDISFPLQNNANMVPNQNNNANMICIPVQNNTISLPTQSSTSIKLPKAPSTQQAGIPTNVANPMSMRPMNRVLPLHRDGQSKVAKAAATPKPSVAPRPRPVCQDMPDLNIKDETVDSDLEKAIEESKRMMELDRIKREKEQEETARAIQQSVQPSTSLTNTEATPMPPLTTLTTGATKMLSLPSLDVDMEEPPKILTEKDVNKIIQPKPPVASKIIKRHAERKPDSETTTTKKPSKISKGQENILKGSSGRKFSPEPPKDDGPKLIYEVTSEDGFNYTSTSLSDLWSKVVESVQNARKVAGLPKLNYNLLPSLSGAHLIGLNNNGLRYLIEQLPGVSRCSKYKAKQGRPLNSWDNDLDLSEGFKESAWGSARIGPVLRKPNHDMFSWMASPFREEPPSFVGQDSENLVSRRLATLPLAMRFRHLKETSKVSVGIYRSHIHGRGLFCKKDIEEGDMVIEYAGEVIRAVLADQREKRYEAMRGRRGVGGCYMFRIDDHLVVDATLKGNAARFINHSCDPNCYSRVVDIHGHKHILIFALRRISVGEELTYDYKFPFEDVKIPCTCGAKKCRKYLN